MKAVDEVEVEEEEEEDRVVVVDGEEVEVEGGCRGEEWGLIVDLLNGDGGEEGGVEEEVAGIG